MTGSLALAKGVLYVGTEEKTAHVRSFDLDGRELDVGFSFRGPDGAAASAVGLDVDEDHRLWVADSTGGELSLFTLFGEAIAGVDLATQGERDAPGVLGRPVDVLSRGCDDQQEVLVASGGVRRHAVQLLPLGPGKPESLRPMGRPDGQFRNVRGIAWRDSFVWVAEAGANRVQVFRDGDFHFAFQVATAGRAAFLPMAIRALEDGRLLVAQGGANSALLLLDTGGRLLSTIVESGLEEGKVFHPADLAVLEGEDDRHTRIVVIDAEGTRVQLFNLAGDSHGTFPGFARSNQAWEPE